MQVTTPVTHIPAQFAKVQRKGVSDQLKKIGKLAKTVFEAVTIPRNFIGSKSWSIPGMLFRLPTLLFQSIFSPQPPRPKAHLFGAGYHHAMEKKLTKEEVKPYLPYACANAAVHSSNLSWVNPIGWKLKSTFFDPETGLKIAVYQKGEEMIFAFGARDSHKTEPDSSGNREDKRIHNKVTKQALLNLFGGKPGVYEKANKWVLDYIRQEGLEKEKITLSGQCYGGSLASYIALKNEMRAFCSNSLPLGPGIQKEIGTKRLQKADQLVTHISAKGDFMSDGKSSTWLDKPISRIGIRTPGNFGRRYVIPSAYTTSVETHNYFLGSMMQHLGHDKRDKPSLNMVSD